MSETIRSLEAGDAIMASMGERVPEKCGECGAAVPDDKDGHWTRWHSEPFPWQQAYAFDRAVRRIAERGRRREEITQEDMEAVMEASAALIQGVARVHAFQERARQGPGAHPNDPTPEDA